MTLPDTPFVCKNIDVEAAAGVLRLEEKRYRSGWNPLSSSELARAIIAAALGEVIPAEVDYSNPLPGEPRERYRTEWQPVVSDKE
jgi:hypothetical protein